jgi:hypothetical protein
MSSLTSSPQHFDTDPGVEFFWIGTIVVAKVSLLDISAPVTFQKLSSLNEVK